MVIFIISFGPLRFFAFLDFLEIVDRPTPLGLVILIIGDDFTYSIPLISYFILVIIANPVTSSNVLVSLNKILSFKYSLPIFIV